MVEGAFAQLILCSRRGAICQCFAKPTDHRPDRNHRYQGEKGPADGIKREPILSNINDRGGKEPGLENDEYGDDDAEDHCEREEPPGAARVPQ